VDQEASEFAAKTLIAAPCGSGSMATTSADSCRVEKDGLCKFCAGQLRIQHIPLVTEDLPQNQRVSQSAFPWQGFFRPNCFSTFAAGLM
jgi:hypothetical protein